MIKATVKPNAIFNADEVVGLKKLNALGAPTVDINGTVEAADIASDAVETAKIKDAAVTNAKVAADAAIGLSKLEGVADSLVIAGDADGAAKAHEIAGDVALSRARSLSYSDGSALSGLVGERVKVVGQGSDPTSHVIEIVKVDTSASKLHFKGISSPDNYAVQDASRINKQPNQVTYAASDPSAAVTVGDTVRGATSTATGIVNSISDTTLTLVNIDGFFQDGEQLQNNSADNAQIGTISGGASDESASQVALVSASGSENSDILVATVDDDSDSLTIVPIANIKPAGTAGQVLTSNGPTVAPSYQAVNVTPAVIQKTTDVSISTETSEHTHAEPGSIINDADGNPTTLVDTNGYSGFSTGDAVILTETVPAGLDAMTVYFIRIDGNNATLHTSESDASSGDNPVVASSTHSTLSLVVNRQLTTCGGVIGGRLFPDKSKDKGSYVLVFNSTINNYVIQASGYIPNGWQDSSKSNMAYFGSAVAHRYYVSRSVPTNETPSRCEFVLAYEHSHGSAYDWKFISLILNSY